MSVDVPQFEYDLSKVFGMKLQQARKRAGMTMRQLGAKIGVTKDQISKYEAGATRISVPTLLVLADALHVSARDLMLGMDTFLVAPDHTSRIVSILTERWHLALIASCVDLTPAKRRMVIEFADSLK